MQVIEQALQMSHGTFRYVGKEAAKEIHDKGWILEDYIEHHGFAYNLRLN